jgi:CO dehydrogenase/acetyl-CoA synthase beta subunit
VLTISASKVEVTFGFVMMCRSVARMAVAVVSDPARLSLVSCISNHAAFSRGSTFGGGFRTQLPSA